MAAGEEINPEKVQYYSQLFDEMCKQRHEMGEEKYGVNTWAGVDLPLMMMEEITDLANYARYTFIKVALLAEMGKLDQPLDEPMPQIGLQSFTPAYTPKDKQ